jgi:hypothetical protein
MATYNKFQDFVEQVLKAVHDLDGTHTLKVALTNVLPVNTQTSFDAVTNHAAPAAANGYTATGNALAGLTLTEGTGTAKLVISDSVFTATAGGIGPFRYAVIYNDTATSPADALIAWYDYGSSITLLDTETFTVDFDPTNGFFTLA